MSYAFMSKIWFEWFALNDLTFCNPGPRQPSCLSSPQRLAFNQRQSHTGRQDTSELHLAWTEFFTIRTSQSNKGYAKSTSFGRLVKVFGNLILDLWQHWFNSILISSISSLGPICLFSAGQAWFSTGEMKYGWRLTPLKKALFPKSDLRQQSCPFHP